MAKRYKVTKEQLERIVENFVMEAAIESKKASTKNMIPSQAAAAKKHVKNKMSGDMVDQSEGMPAVTPMKKKHSQAAEAKKHMSKAGMKHTNKAKVVKEDEEKKSGKTLEGGDVWKMIQNDIPNLVKKMETDHMSGVSYMDGLTEKDEKMVEDANKDKKGFLVKRLIPVVRQAVQELHKSKPELGILNDKGEINAKALRDATIREELIGKIATGLGISTALAGIIGVGIVWLIKTSLAPALIAAGAATALSLTGMGTLVLGGIIAAYGKEKYDRAKAGQRAATAVEKSENK